LVFKSFIPDSITLHAFGVLIIIIRIKEMIEMIVRKNVAKGYRSRKELDNAARHAVSIQRRVDDPLVG